MPVDLSPLLQTAVGALVTLAGQYLTWSLAERGRERDQRTDEARRHAEALAGTRVRQGMALQAIVPCLTELRESAMDILFAYERNDLLKVQPEEAVEHPAVRPAHARYRNALNALQAAWDQQLPALGAFNAEIQITIDAVERLAFHYISGGHEHPNLTMEGRAELRRAMDEGLAAFRASVASLVDAPTPAQVLRP